MAIIERGKVKGGQIVLAHPVPFPEDTEVEIRIEPLSRPVPESVPKLTEDFAALPFFGMWAERHDLPDSTTVVDQERQQWHQPKTEQGTERDRSPRSALGALFDSRNRP